MAGRALKGYTRGYPDVFPVTLPGIGRAVAAGASLLDRERSLLPPGWSQP
jgi:hypothetical protein